MNKAFLHYQPRNPSRKFRWMVRDSYFNYKFISGWFASRESATRWRDRWENETSLS